MELAIYQVDAFAEKLFEGNPAAVVPLERWLPDKVMQHIARENNLSETAFFVKQGEHYQLRWFTPLAEVDLCGHATLATAHVLYEILGYKNDRIIFASKSGELSVSKKDNLIELDFPVAKLSRVDITDNIVAALGSEPRELWKADDYIAVYEAESEVQSLIPDFRALAAVDCRGIAITAPGDSTDFVCRFFAPAVGIDEDPVTGSLYCELVPYWARVLGRNRFVAAQLSRRGGKVQCELAQDRVLIAGGAVTYLSGMINIPEVR